MYNAIFGRRELQQRGLWGRPDARPENLVACRGIRVFMALGHWGGLYRPDGSVHQEPRLRGVADPGRRYALGLR